MVDVALIKKACKALGIGLLIPALVISIHFFASNRLPPNPIVVSPYQVHHPIRSMSNTLFLAFPCCFLIFSLTSPHQITSSGFSALIRTKWIKYFRTGAAAVLAEFLALVVFDVATLGMMNTSPVHLLLAYPEGLGVPVLAVCIHVLRDLTSVPPVVPKD